MAKHPIRALGRFLLGHPALRHRPAPAYAAACMITVAAIALPVALDQPLLGEPVVTLFPAVILSAYLGGLGPGLASVFLGLAGSWFFISPPVLSFRSESGYDLLALLIYLAAAVVTCLVVDGLRQAYDSLSALASQRAVLLLEQQHRVKNHVQLISALLGLQARLSGNDAVRQGLLEARARLNAVAGAYANVYAPDMTIGFHDHLRHLADALRTGVAGRGVSIDLDAVEAHWDADLVVPVSLIANELISNALEHGDPGRPVNVRLLRLDGGRMSLAVFSSGGPLPPAVSPAASTGLGLRIVDMLARQIGGEFRIDHATGTFAVGFPERRPAFRFGRATQSPEAVRRAE